MVLAVAPVAPVKYPGAAARSTSSFELLRVVASVTCLEMLAGYGHLVLLLLQTMILPA